MVEPSTTRKKSRFWLYLPFVLLLILVGAWTGYWLFAKAQIDKGIDQWIAGEQARGTVVEYSAKSLGGFPYRFELVVDDPELAAEQFASLCKGMGDLERRFGMPLDSRRNRQRIASAVDVFCRAYAVDSRTAPR